MKKIFLITLLITTFLYGCADASAEEVQPFSTYEWESIAVETPDKLLEPVNYEKNTYDTLNYQRQSTWYVDQPW